MTTINYAYNRFCKKRFPLPREAQLAAIEERIGIVFPDDYRQFILEYNGGYFNEPEIYSEEYEYPQCSLRYLKGIGASHESAELATVSDLVLFDDNDPPIFVPIGSTEMGGLILLITEEEGRGEIVFKKEWGDFYYMADSLADFFALLREPSWGSASE